MPRPGLTGTSLANRERTSLASSTAAKRNSTREPKHLRPELRFAVGGDYHVHPERRALVDDHVDLLDQDLVLLGQCPVVVDHQVHVAETVVGHWAGLTAELA